MAPSKAKPWLNGDLNKLSNYAKALVDDEPHNETDFISNDINVNNKSSSLRKKKKLKKVRQLEQAMKLGTADDKMQNEETSLYSQVKKKSIRDRLYEELELSLVVKPKVDDSINDSDSKNKFVKATYATDSKTVVFQDLAKKKTKSEAIAQKQLLIAKKQLRAKKEEEKLLEKESREEEEEGNIFDLKKSRFEVMRFGVSGFRKKSKDEANIALAIKLGAKPPKRTFINYRDLMEVKKMEKICDKEEEINNQRKHLMKTKIKTRDRNKVAGFDAQIGQFKNGVQVLKSHDIKRVNNSVKKASKTFGK